MTGIAQNGQKCLIFTRSLYQDSKILKRDGKIELAPPVSKSLTGITNFKPPLLPNTNFVKRELKLTTHGNRTEIPLIGCRSLNHYATLALVLASLNILYTHP